MNKSMLSRLYPLAIALLLFLGSGAAVVAQSPERKAGKPADQSLVPEQIAYWRMKYRELTAAADPRVAMAHAIFAQLVQVAGRRPGVEPRLFIIASEPWDITLPIAIRDGWIILSKGALEICFREPVWGKDRLAFVLAHELAHQMKGDLWHMQFFDALEASHTHTPLSPAFRKELDQSLTATEHVLAREVQADQQGILYATMAGFTPQAIVSADQGVNFFADWVHALDPRRVLGMDVAHVRPTPAERAEALRTTLRQIADQATAFHAGLWFYYAGDYLQAIQAFDTFRAVFASPEVHLNLAVSHHQLALQASRASHATGRPVPFHLALAIDPLTRASQVYLGRTRGQPTEPAGLFRQHLEAAIHWYREALAQAATSTLAARNLGAALILRGVQTPKPAPHPDFAEAVMRLARALEDTPQDPALLNTLGVALFYDERPERAQAAFTQATTVDPAAAAPWFNLSVLAQTAGREAETEHYRQRYERLTGGPAPAAVPAHPPGETVTGVLPGMPVQDVPALWGVPMRSTVPMGGTPYTMATSPAGIMTLAQHGEILMLLVREGHRGTSAQGIALGSRADDVLARYGPPTRRHELPRGQSWAYDAPRIAFQLHDGRVVSWLRF